MNSQKYVINHFRNFYIKLLFDFRSLSAKRDQKFSPNYGNIIPLAKYIDMQIEQVCIKFK